MQNSTRQKSLKILNSCLDISLCRDIESSIHAFSKTEQEYIDNVLRVSFNVYSNPSVAHPDIVVMRDEDLLEGTLLEKIKHETKMRNDRYNKILQEKYDQINEKGYTAILKCRRCGSEEVSYDEKQTRGADEAATVFCFCQTCSNRWVMR